MTTPSLEIVGLRKSFGNSEIIRGINLTVSPGERIAIIGPNGAGKSTLFNLVSGRFAPSAGQILLNGQDIVGLAPYQINRLGLSRSFQITNIFHQLSIFENLRCAVLWSLGYRRIIQRTVDAFNDTAAGCVTEPVDRRIVEGNNGDGSVLLISGAHGSFLQ